MAPRGKRSRIAADKRIKFLSALAESSNVTKAAKIARITPSAAYHARREDPEFAREWLAALWEGYTHLEMEVLRRLREGDQQTKAADKYDFANAIRLLTAHRDNAARAQAQQRNVSAAEVRASIDQKVDAIRQQVRREKERANNDRSGNS
jgi:ribosome-associated translation inhibitor RaiA